MSKRLVILGKGETVSYRGDRGGLAVVDGALIARIGENVHTRAPGRWYAADIFEGETPEAPGTDSRLLNCRALLTQAEKLIRDKPEAERSGAEKNLLFDIEAMKERC